jgi:predicted AAA+ superfamily ATPase
VIRGARQVGKTTVIEQFASEFDTFLHLNLERKPDRKIFDDSESAVEALKAVYLLKNKAKCDGRVLLFIDEIQYSPAAVAMLRYFYEDIPDLYVVAAGSLLETLIDDHISFPVGRVEYLALHPCSFSEFLGAIGETSLQEALLGMELPAAIHNRVMKLFNEYALVGGMPEAVALYAESHDLVALRKVYDSILGGYRDDIEKYAQNKSERNVLRHILMNGWRFAGQRIKFESFANSNYKSREMGEAFRTLEKAMLLELVYPTALTDLPVSPDYKKSPKLLWLDTGLVNHASLLQNDLFGIQDISDAYKGKIAEHVVSQLLFSQETSVLAKRIFWVRDARNSQAEVDFAIDLDGVLLPIEVKSGNNSKLRSMQFFMQQSKSAVAVRFWNNPLSRDFVSLPSGKQYTLINVPFYYAECLRHLSLSNS